MCCRRQSTARLELSAGAMLRDVAGKFMSAFTGRSVHPVTAKSLLVGAIAVPYQAAGLEIIALAMLRGTAGKFMAAFSGHSY